MSEVHLVTGGCGFIGKHLVNRLLAEGKVVRVIDDLSTARYQEFQLRTNFYEFSIEDMAKVAQWTDGVTHVYHLAALPSVSRSVSDPLHTAHVNIIGTLNLLEAARQNLSNLKRFVFASSSSVYGGVLTEAREQVVPRATSPYALTKLAAERYCSMYHELYGVPTVSLRLFNVYGPGQATGQYAAVIPAFIEALRDGKPLQIYGDTKISRDFTFVEKVVDAFVMATQKEEAIGQVINIGNGYQRTLDELTFALTKIMKISVYAQKILPPRKGDVPRSCADVTKMKEIFGLAEDDFEKCLRKTVEFYT